MAAGSRSAAAERHDEEALELSLRLRTGDSSGSSAAVEEAAAAARRRSMTIFYNGRVCAVDVTELQARTIITMANHQILTEQQQQRMDNDRHLQDSSSSTSSNSAAAHCGGHQDTKPPVAPQRSPPRLAPPPGLTAAGVAPVISQAAAAELSMKRSLQQFLQKRKTRVAAAGSPYAGGRQAATHS
ncbi:protein TIFY 5-like [Lolium rigidum]|uniref:protein TIFY 5-like n=1 Tax=Lolium rigidum TaxID=89674 RepID=UPI001F5C9FFF|nr:protein TIFY 5-like [Lolium rigidum]